VSYPYFSVEDAYTRFATFFFLIKRFNLHFGQNRTVVSKFTYELALRVRSAEIRSNF
jgi:hypothetical protein